MRGGERADMHGRNDGEGDARSAVADENAKESMGIIEGVVKRLDNRNLRNLWDTERDGFGF